MWVFLNNSFLSIVAHRDKPLMLLVRARFKGDIERVFPDATVSRTPDADYLYRATIYRSEVAAALMGEACTIKYLNFKGSVEEHWRHKACMDVWSIMHRAQGVRDGGGLVGSRPPALVLDDIQKKPTRKKKPAAKPRAPF